MNQLKQIEKRSSFRYYRFITRLTVYPWLLILLFLWWGFSIVNLYKREKIPHLPNTEALALNALDRELQLAEALKYAPEWQRSLLQVGSVHETFDSAKEAISLLADKVYLQGAGGQAWHLLHKGNSGALPINDWTSEAKEYFRDTIESDDCYWWHEQELWNASSLISADKIKSVRMREEVQRQKILERATYSSLVLIGFIALGLFLLAFVIKEMRKDLLVSSGYKFSIYQKSIHLSLVLGLFLISEFLTDSLIRDLGMLPSSLVTSFGGKMVIDLLFRFLPVIMLLVVVFRSLRVGLRRIRFWGRPRMTYIVASIALLLLVNPILALLFYQNNPLDMLGDLNGEFVGMSGLIFMLISGCILAPISEEILFRGILLPALQTKLNFWMAALVSSVLFSVIHGYDFYGSISVGLFGFTAAVLARLTGSLATSIALHACYNFLILSDTWIVMHSPL